MNKPLMAMFLWQYTMLDLDCSFVQCFSSSVEGTPASSALTCCASVMAAVDFFNQVNILYGTLMEFCTPATCPTMSAGPK